jgi:archaellum biogenesis protein FlaJ (TadC family)
MSQSDKGELFFMVVVVGFLYTNLLKAIKSCLFLFFMVLILFGSWIEDSTPKEKIQHQKKTYSLYSLA